MDQPSIFLLYDEKRCSKFISKSRLITQFLVTALTKSQRYPSVYPLKLALDHLNEKLASISWSSYTSIRETMYILYLAVRRSTIIDLQLLCETMDCLPTIVDHDLYAEIPRLHFDYGEIRLLQFAVYHQSLEKVKLLVQYGADAGFNARTNHDNKWKDPLVLAIKRANPHIALFLSQVRASGGCTQQLRDEWAECVVYGLSISPSKAMFDWAFLAQDTKETPPWYDRSLLVDLAMKRSAGNPLISGIKYNYVELLMDYLVTAQRVPLDPRVAFNQLACLFGGARYDKVAQLLEAGLADPNTFDADDSLFIRRFFNVHVPMYRGFSKALKSICLFAGLTSPKMVDQIVELRKSKKMYVSHEVPDEIEQLVKWITDISVQGTSLKELARMTVRKAGFVNEPELMRMLPVTLRKFVMQPFA